MADAKKSAFFKTANSQDFFVKISQIFKKKFFFCFIPIKISPNLHGRMDELKF